MQLTILGAGSSAGTPVIGCGCLTCLSDNPKNKRTRCSSAITMPNGEVILIDTGPDLRTQALRENLTRVDAVLYTHTHADHLHGIDDLRAFCQLQKKQIPLYGKQDTLAHILAKFGYTIRDPGDFWELPVLSLNEIDQAFELFGVTITPIPVKHGRSDILGYRLGNMAYLTDVSEIPESSLALLNNLDLLLLDCLRYTTHFTHIHLEQSLAYASLIKAKQNYLIHMTHDIEYEALSSELPNNVHVGFDGLTLEF
ncbi:MBL fold metallo-hydrolase [Methyloradius palustris]|uniref:Hydrolase n=1 Tax=Methyloradius palustris TaxID=2778876 RepID=A0A8D5FZF0_9PROT|nr:MBL fold metallo-hydrolase [Methyloradius palustris]BCM25069.1 hydrolase [Methyloradius palustris]